MQITTVIPVMITILVPVVISRLLPWKYITTVMYQ